MRTGTLRGSFTELVMNHVQTLRLQKGLSQVDVARIVGVDRTAYSRMENRGRSVTVEELALIAIALDTTASDLLDWKQF